jgi:hypothetical protein
MGDFLKGADCLFYDIDLKLFVTFDEQNVLFKGEMDYLILMLC